MKMSFWRGVLVVVLIPSLSVFGGMGFSRSLGFGPDSIFVLSASITGAFFLVVFLLEHFYQKGVRAGAEKERQEILSRQMHKS